MRKILLGLLMLAPVVATAETVTLGGTDYEVKTLIDREIGPGIRHTRFRLPDFPLNINVLRVDLNNPYNSLETTVPNESAKGTETLVHAAERQSYAGHRALAGANANFWVVSSQPEAAVYNSTTRNASVRNGAIVTESNQHRDQWDGGTMRTGVVGIGSDKTAYVDYCTSYIHATSAKFGTLEIHQSNKGVHDDELCMYNHFYGPTREFQPLKIEGGKYQLAAGGDATEVILDFSEGAKWEANTDIPLTVKEIRLNAGKGKLGEHDLALVGRGENAGKLAQLAVGDVVTLSYGWIYNPGSAAEARPKITNAVGGNAMVMVGGQLTDHNDNEQYNSQVYSRTGYGCSQDGKMLYIIVIDKATDPVYGTSNGCNTAKMCEFARWLGCYNMSNFDAGGSAQMFVNGKVENRTTEGTPRALGNGMLVYSTAPEDADDYNTITRLEFDDVVLQSPVYASFSPRMLAYNRYGAVVDDNFTDFTLSCPAELGTCSGNTFFAGGQGASGDLTASYGSVSVSKHIDIVSAELSLRIKQLLIDGKREYPVEVISHIGDTEFGYDPSTISWNVENPAVATIDGGGILRGVAEGTTSYTCSIGEFQDNGTVTVEIAPAPEMAVESWAGWSTKKAAGIKDVVLTDDGHLSYTYDNPRDPNVGVSNDYRFYSLPDAIRLTFTSDLPLRNIICDMRAATTKKPNNITILPTEGETFAAGVSHTIELPLSEVGDTEDLATFPVTLKSITFKIAPDATNKGAHSIDLTSLRAEYSNNSGIEDIAVRDAGTAIVGPNPVESGSSVGIRAPGLVGAGFFSISGIALSHERAAEGSESMTLSAPAAAGAYVLRIESASGTESRVIIVK